MGYSNPGAPTWAGIAVLVHGPNRQQVAAAGKRVAQGMERGEGYAVEVHGPRRFRNLRQAAKANKISLAHDEIVAVN